MAGGFGFVRYPQQPPPAPAAVGQALEQEAQQQAQARLAQGPGFLPYRGVGRALSGVAPVAAPPSSPVPQMAQPGVGGQLLAPQTAPTGGQALVRHAALLQRHGVPPHPLPPHPLMGGPTRG